MKRKKSFFAIILLGILVGYQVFFHALVYVSQAATLSQSSDVDFGSGTFVSTVVSGSGSGAYITPDTRDNWYNADWTYRVAVTIEADVIDDGLTEFPVYVDLSDLGSSFFSEVANDGGDIRVIISDGQTEIPREVVAINTNLETGELHFCADTISSSDTIAVAPKAT